jgi:lipopolysaccharide transport system permease protein
VFQDLAATYLRWRTWFLMASQDIEMRYRRSILGPFWISIAMAVLVFSIGLLYAEVQNLPFKEFLTFFGCGLLAWTFMSSMMTEGCQLLIESEAHLRNVPLPSTVLAARVVMRNAIILLHNLAVVGLMLIWFGNMPGPTALLALPGYMLYALYGWLFAVTFGPLCARFRDLTQIVGSILQVMFFLTPIFWMPGTNMDRHVAVEGNPFYHLVEITRRPLLGEPATATNWLVALGVTAMIAMCAMLVLQTTRKRVFLWL